VAISLWVYSYQAYARLSGYTLDRYMYMAVEIWQGGVRCTLDKNPDPVPDPQEQSAKFTSVPAGDVELALKQQLGASAMVFPPGIFGFSYRNHYGFRSVTIPNWVAVLVACAIGVTAKPAPRLRFGLRELLTLTTVVGITAAIIGTLLRNSQ
jgi:hypothetical protein